MTTMPHPYPDGTLVKTHGKSGDADVYGVIESYIRDYNPCDSFYFVLIDGQIESRDRNDVRPIKT